MGRHLSAIITYQAPQVQHSEFVFLCYKAQVPNEIQFAQKINLRKNKEFFFDEKRFSAIYMTQIFEILKKLFLKCTETNLWWYVCLRKLGHSQFWRFSLLSENCSVKTSIMKLQ